MLCSRRSKAKIYLWLKSGKKVQLEEGYCLDFLKLSLQNSPEGLNEKIHIHINNNFHFTKHEQVVKL